MSDQHFLSAAAPAEVFGPLQGGERVMWRGRCGVAEYAFHEAASLPRWTLPETTDVLVTDQRVLYAYTAEDGHQVRSGELRWLWPQHLRVQPGARSTDRGAAATQIQLVCGGADGTYPALVFAGGELASVGDADRLANVIRQAIARFRVDNVEKLGLTASQGRMLSRLLIGPEFRNHQGGDGQTVSLLGAMLVNRQTPAPEVDVETLEAEVIEESLLDDPFLEVFPADKVFQAEEVFQPDDTLAIDDLLQPDQLSGRDPLFPTDGVLPNDEVLRADADSSGGGPPFASEPVSAAGRSPELTPAAESAPSGPALPAHREDRSISEGTRLIAYRPGRAADAARALMAAKAEEATQQTEPATASRAAELAARIASLVSGSPEPPQPEQSPEPFPAQKPQQFRGRLEDRPTDDHRSFGARLSEMRSADAGRPEEVGSPQHDAWSRGPWHAEPRYSGPESSEPKYSEPRYSEPRHSGPRHSETRAAERAAAEREATGRAAAERAGTSRAGTSRAGTSRAGTSRAGTNPAGTDQPGTDDPADAERAAAEREAAERNMPTTNLARRAESMRRTAARMAANAARGRVSDRRGDREPGISSRGNRNT